MRKILAVLGVLGLVVMACGGGGGAGSPEDAVRGAFDAIKSGDIDAMAQYMPESERSEITDMSDEEKEAVQGMLAMLGDMEVNILNSEIDGETAIVTVEMTFMGQTNEEEIEVIKENGSWVLTDMPL